MNSFHSHRHFILAVMLIPVLTFTSTRLTSSSPTNATAPSGAATPATDKDVETGKPIVTTPSGLKYVELTPGTGAAVKTGDHVSVNYVGKLLDGTIFDASSRHGQPFDYVQGVTSLIPGWTEGTSTMKVGGKRKLIIPPQLGYGLEGSGDVIPPNSTLIFEIELISAKAN